MREPIDALRSLKKYVALTLADDDDWEIRLAYEDGTFERPFCRVESAGDAAEAGGRYDGEIVLPVQILCHPREQLTADESILEAERVRSILRRAFRIGAGAIPAPAAPVLAADAGALPAATYIYRVTALTRFGESAASPSASITLPATGGVALSWAAVPGTRCYRVYRGVVAGSERVMAEVLDPELLDDGGRNLGAIVNAAGRGTLGQPMSVPLWDWDDVAFEDTTRARLEPDFMRVRGLTTNRVGDDSDPIRQTAVIGMRLAWRASVLTPAQRAMLTDVIVGPPVASPPAPPGPPSSPPPGAPGAPEAPFDVVLGG